LLGGDIDADADADLDADADADADGEGDGGEGAMWLSMRFWTFFDAFFGLTGVALTLAGLEPWPTLVSAIGTGLVASLSVGHALRRLKRAQISSGVSAIDLVGERGTVLLPLEPGAPGKIRLSLKGRDLEVVASTAVHRAPIGAQVRVREVTPDGTALVVPVNL